MGRWLGHCIQDTLSSRAALGLPAAFRPSASREQRYLAYQLGQRSSKGILHKTKGHVREIRVSCMKMENHRLEIIFVSALDVMFFRTQIVFIYGILGAIFERV